MTSIPFSDWKPHLIQFFIPVLGQLITRVFWLNGSLDKIWLFLPVFAMPPLNFMVNLMMQQGWIKRGELKKSPIDKSVFEIGILSVLLPSLITAYSEGLVSSTVNTLIIFFALFVGYTYIHYTRMKDDCQSNGKEPNYYRSMEFAGYAAGITGVAPLIIMALGFVPYIGKALTTMIDIPTTVFGAISPMLGSFFENGVYATFTCSFYVIYLMWNSTIINEYCAEPSMMALRVAIAIGTAGAGAIMANNMLSSAMDGIMGGIGDIGGMGGMGGLKKFM